MKIRFLFLIAYLLLGIALSGCTASRPTPDAVAIETVIMVRVFATLTASAPTLAPVAITTPAPSAVPLPTSAVVPSPTTIPPTLTPTALPPTPSPTGQPSPTATPEGSLATVQSATLNVRAGPGTGHAVVATAKQGDRLPVTGRNTDGSWLEVTLSDGRSGWISASLAQLNVSTDTVAVAKIIPTPPSAPAVAAQPAVGKRDLEVSFINPHYDCEQGELFYWGTDGKQYPLWGYRYFQIDMFIKNNGTEPVVPPWRVTRWSITDGVTEGVSDRVWEWTGRSGFYAQPTIQPGQTAGWTFIGFPIDRNQWLKAVEFVWKGQVYRQEFGLGQFGNAYNYKDCGDPRPHTFRPTPTPWP